MKAATRSRRMLPAAVGSRGGNGDRDRVRQRRWRLEHTFLLVPAQQFVGQFLATFKDFPPSPIKIGTNIALTKIWLFNGNLCSL